jgi:hypothetical protein
MIILLLSASISASLTHSLLGEWIIFLESEPPEHLYTIEFHKSDPRTDVLLNSTIWRDDFHTPSKFPLNESPLIAKLQISSTNDHEIVLTSIIPSSGPLCTLSFIKGVATSSINGTQMTVTLASSDFHIQYGNDQSYVMKKAKHIKSSRFSSPVRSSTESGSGSRVLFPFGHFSDWMDWIDEYTPWIGLAAVLLAAQIVIFSVCRACTRRPAAPEKRRIHAQHQKSSDEHKEKVE